ncbi:MAG: N-carbamoylputrescine amidase [Trueperaceae bacterium]|nr:N-carbamoylputrescine amidase [Trueperaceae bacterium]
MSCSNVLEENLAKAEAFVREAAANGANVVLLQELFENLYFPQIEREELFELAHPVDNHPFLARFSALAAELGVVLPVSFFEKAGQAYFNSLAMIDADGRNLGVYRKSHIPDGPGYEEKYYFNPGDSGFKTWSTRFGAIGVGICWDQWFPETARAMALKGADLLLYPTAIGSEPQEAGGLDTKDMWQRAMLGHAVSNSVYLAAANRVGREGGAVFYGHSFIADMTGSFLAEADRTSEGVIYADLDLAAARRFRAGFGFFRDRRPELYGPLLTLDGRES